MERLRTANVLILVGICVVAAMAAWPLAALASPAPVTSPLLPPTEGQYVSPALWHAIYNTYGVALSDPAHSRFVNIVRTSQPGYEQEQFNSTLMANTNYGPVTLNGPVVTRVYGYTSGAMGTFNTEIVSMTLSGVIGGMSVQIRESPTLQSTGQTSIVDLGGGNYTIDSFFDVFTDLRIENGPWDDGEYPDGPPTMAFIPEPSTLSLLALAGLVAMCRRPR